jgi:hypothetical protein
VCRSNCFKGEFKIPTQSILGNADLKRLRGQLMDEYPDLTKKALNKVLPKTAQVNLLKCSNGTQLYVPGDGPPAFFDDGFGGMYAAPSPKLPRAHLMRAPWTHSLSLSLARAPPTLLPSASPHDEDRACAPSRRYLTTRALRARARV